MKVLFVICCVFFSGWLTAQTYVTGDVELNNTLTSVNADANKNLPDFKARIVKTYGTTLPEVNTAFSAGMTAGDVFMAFEVGRIAKKPIATVISEWKTNKGKGWGVMAKNLGIKPGSPEFHQLKSNSKSHAGGMKPAKGANSASGSSNGNGHGNSHSNGKGNGNGHSKK